MMFGLFMKKLVTDTSAEEIARVTAILEQKQIHFEVRTQRSRGSVGSGLDAGAYARGNLAMYKGASQPVFIYSVYVNPKDFHQARRLTAEV